jgi:hypothetical protein
MFDTTPTAQDAVIANGTSLSGALRLAKGRRQLVAIQLPGTWTAASVTFAVSHDDATYVPLYFGDTEYALTAAAASRGFSLDPAAFAGWPYVKIRSGTAGSPVNQAAERTVKALTRAV